MHGHTDLLLLTHYKTLIMPITVQLRTSMGPMSWSSWKQHQLAG